MRPLKSLDLIAILLAVQGAAPLGAAIHLISIEHRVWGDAGKSPSSFYDETSSGALSRNILSIDATGAEYFASSSANDWSVAAYRRGDAYYCNAYARNTYVFTPDSRELSISLVGQIGIWWFENDAQMTLTDLTTDSIVSLYQSPSYFFPQNPFPDSDAMRDYAIRWDSTVAVNPAHQYELILFVGAHRSEGGTGSASLELSIIPEADTTLLTGAAVLITCVRRRRRDLSCLQG